jgi:hypothetical protein
VLSYLQAGEVLDMMRRQAVCLGFSAQGQATDWPSDQTPGDFVPGEEGASGSPSRVRRSG